MYNIIPLGIIIISLIIILLIIIRKFPALSSVNPEPTPEEEQNKLREKLVIERIKRRLREISGVEKVKFFRQVNDLFKKKFLGFYKKLLTLEKKYKLTKFKETGVKDQDKEKIKIFLREASELIKGDNLEEAEKKLLKIIEIDPYNVSAYEGLGDIYKKLKQFDQAKEIFEHILKIDKDNCKAYIGLGNIYFQLGDYVLSRENYLKAYRIKRHNPLVLFDLAEACKSLEYNEEALSYLKEAVNIEPNNPKYLDSLIELSIVLKDKNLAKNSLLKLKQINPDNKKILEYKNKLNELEV